MEFCVIRYHVPRSWLKPTRNLLVVFEELGGDASKIVLVKRSLKRVCADVYENHPTYLESNIIAQSHRSEAVNVRLGAKVHLSCAPGQTISSVEFASFGTPTGTCGSLQMGSCHAPSSQSVVEKVNGNKKDPSHLSNVPKYSPCPRL